MKTALACFLALTALACAQPIAPAVSSKEDARAAVAKGDHLWDFCFLFDWYGDGVCDDFCLEPDPDCQASPYCYADDDCAADERCNAGEVCLSPCAPDQICPAVCAGFCVEAEQEAMCGGIAGLPCSDSDYCDYEDPSHPDAAGICKPRPEACYKILAPVCGTDGQTHPNDCMAHSAGADVLYAGECL